MSVSPCLLGPLGGGLGVDEVSAQRLQGESEDKAHVVDATRQGLTLVTFSST
jgi:hypothetical protein